LGRGFHRLVSDRRVGIAESLQEGLDRARGVKSPQRRGCRPPDGCILVGERVSHRADFVPEFAERFDRRRAPLGIRGSGHLFQDHPTVAGARET
jgi:hypothetical protein